MILAPGTNALVGHGMILTIFFVHSIEYLRPTSRSEIKKQQNSKTQIVCHDCQKQYFFFITVGMDPQIHPSTFWPENPFAILAQW